MSIKRIHSPHHGKKVTVGACKLPTKAQRAAIPKLSDYRHGRRGLAFQAPTTGDWTQKARASLDLIYLNDIEGDCVIAGSAHIRGVTSGNATGSPVIFSDTDINHDYSAITGYVSGDESTDQGTDPIAAMQYYMQSGWTDGVKLAGYVLIDATDDSEVYFALQNFENVAYCIGPPDAWVNPFPSGPGWTWDVAGDADPDNGHFFMAAAWNPNVEVIGSWGMLGKITKQARAKYASAAQGGMMLALLTQDIIAKGQLKSPGGLAWADLQADLASMQAALPQS